MAEGAGERAYELVRVRTKRATEGVGLLLLGQCAQRESHDEC